MKYKEFELIFTLIYNEYKKRDEFLDLIPASLRTSIFDNEYTNSIEIVNDRLMESIFSMEVFYDVNYFLYEWEAGFTVINNDIKYVINDFGDILNYFALEHKTF